MEIISVNNITKKYGKRIILNNISFSVPKGVCIAIVGKNGCGKSTLLNILSGSKPAQSGEILILGKRAAYNSRIFSDYIGFVPQENPLFENLTVSDNLKFWYCNTGKAIKTEFENGIPASFGLTPYKHYPVRKLSGGMKKRLSIACALVKDPELLILDEPAAALDIICKEEIRNYLAEYKKNGGTIIITSHETSDLSIADKMYIMENGTLSLLEQPLTGSALAKRLEAYE